MASSSFGCSCGSCKPMPTNIESMCCNHYLPQTLGGVRMNKMLSEGGINCICQHAEFVKLLDVDLLEHWGNYYAQYSPKYFAAMGKAEQRRHVAYRRTINWLFGKLKAGERIPLPACVVTRIRQYFPAPDGRYKGFHYKFV